MGGMSTIARVLYFDTERFADALYFSRVQVPDAFVGMEIEGERIGVLSMLEFDRVSRDSALDTVLPLEDVDARARQAFGLERARPGDHIALLARERGLERIRVGGDFPAAVLRQLEAHRLAVDVVDGSLFPERECKSREEAEAIRAGNEASTAGFRVVERVLREAQVRADGTLVHAGETLTSERLREQIDIACLECGAHASGTIVAGGDQACDPHGRGTGPLRAGELIIVDIFPRVAASGYHGDMTRTYLKGSASDAQRALVATVAEAQRQALAEIRAGADGVAIYRRVRDFFTAEGYPTEKRNGLHVGFFHGLGHGLGLEVHEPPRMGRIGAPLKTGHVVTVEPGLYYPGLGGCRIEDVAWVTADGYELLSAHPYEWQV